MAGEPDYESPSGLVKPYYMDPASIAAARAAEAGPGMEVLDLCAAPGGKSLVLACGIFGDSGGGRLVSNDRSSARRRRLHLVLDEHLPSAWRQRIEVTGHDARRWGLYESDRYDRVLADVPCSSERHLLDHPRALESWSPARTRHLAVQAYTILKAGFTALKPGGILLYSTCTLSEYENEGVIKRFLDKHPQAKLLSPQSGLRMSMTEAVLSPEPKGGSLGQRIWPDKSGGLGPIFFARITKNTKSTRSDEHVRYNSPEGPGCR
ncbi:MAG: RsmB/NOP family class I SAM-dependent RNA methyltransferase [Spirochaetales bacterium]|nr:RsmB/NOP family class I SAM-dependent RNA methyltransferase [Spirochaetales bacterium]MCF7938476.1 RsmB/NOP family class I SAM-dependent RNA methyltransferase [Spirochaetales bacterium]